MVTLRGHVRSFYEKQLGGQSARRVAGVIDVIDAIQVASDDSLLSGAADRRQVRRSQVVAPVVVSFDSHRGRPAASLQRGGLNPISQAKG